MAYILKKVRSGPEQLMDVPDFLKEPLPPSPGQLQDNLPEKLKLYASLSSPSVGIQPVLPSTVEEREKIPMCTGFLDYFPLAVAAVANLSLVANEQHNPGEPMHWARGKSLAHADKILKHLTDRGTYDTDGIRHSAKLAWRALALLQTELEADGGLPGRASQFNSKEI